MNAHGDTRDDEDAAERSHRDRMRAIYARVSDIDTERQTLAREKAELLSEVCESIGISPGVVLDNVRGEKAQVVTCHGDFDISLDGKLGGPYTVYPSAVCEVAPATKDGFHSRTRIRHRHLDKEESFKAQKGYPLPSCPECGSSMLYEEGEPWEGPSHGCPICGHVLPGVRSAATKQPAGEVQEAMAGELDPRRAEEFGRLISRYSESFNGQEWGGPCESVDRQNLAVALDHLTEAGAMLMNLAGRLLTSSLKAEEKEALDLKEVAAKIAAEVAKNCGSVPQLTFPHIYLGLKEWASASPPPPAAPAVPEGMTLVPVEPSEAMFTAFNGQIDIGVVYTNEFLAAYRAMLAAAAQQPKEPGA